MVKIVDRHNEALIWSRKCSGCARCRLGPQLMNRCKPEKLVTKDHSENVEKILKLEEREVPDRRRERKGHQERLQEVERGT